jgi:4-amino-4-deoxy-L-arabinose transferase-like glycosyltransferase
MISRRTLANTRYYRILATILFVGLALRLLAVVWIPTLPTSDFWSYFQRASSLADSGDYEAVPGRPDASYPPGYPLLLSLFFRLPLERLIAAKLFNVALGVISILLVSEITRSLFGDPASLIAAAIMAASPRSILSTLLIASENLFLPLLLAWVLAMLTAAQKERLKATLLGGFLLGLATLVRAVAWLLSIPWLLSQLPLRLGPRRLAVRFMLLLLTQAIVMLPWAIRNSLTLGRATFLTSTGGINLFIGNNPNATGQWYPWLEDMQATDPGFSERSLVDQDRSAARAALRWIDQNPLNAVSLYLSKWRLMFNDDRFVLDAAVFATHVSPPWPAADALPGDHPLKTHAALLVAFINTFYWVLLILELAGAVVCLAPSRRKAAPCFLSSWLLLALSAFYFPAVSAIFLASTRFRWPTSDLMIPFAAAAIVFALRAFPGRMREVSGLTTRCS